MEVTAFHAGGGTLTTGYPASLQAILLGKNLSGWHIECRTSDDFSYAHAFMMIHGRQAIINLSNSIDEEQKIQGLRFLLNRLADTPLYTTDTFLWHVGDQDEMDEPTAYERVLIFDTTLRNGAETPGVKLGLRQKVELAQQLARLGVNILEVGFPERAAADATTVRRIAQVVGTPDGPIIAALAQADRASITTAWEALQPATKRRLHIFLSTSDLHIQQQMQSNREAIIQRAREAVLYARSLCADIEFTAMDASRSELNFLYQVLTTVIEAGATTLNIPDTVGYRTPSEYGALIANIRRHVPGVERVILSTHCHNDLGMAVANTLAGVQAGARQVECTINGVGERAGNAPLEEVIMALKTRLDLYGVKTTINTKELARTSRLVRDTMDIPIAPHKPIVGEGTTIHKEGIHREGVLKNPLLFQIIAPEEVGLESTLPYPLLDSQSTYGDFRTRLRKLGYDLSYEQASHFFVQFREVAAQKKVVSDAEVVALLKEAAQRPQDIYTLDHLSVHCGLNTEPSASVRLKDRSGQMHLGQAFGTGPIDAAYQAINSIVAQKNELFKFTINAITEGVDSTAEVTVRVRVIRTPSEGEHGEEDVDPDIYEGYGVHPDTVVAATYAYMHVLNRILTTRIQSTNSKSIGSEPILSHKDVLSGSTRMSSDTRDN